MLHIILNLFVLFGANAAKMPIQLPCQSQVFALLDGMPSPTVWKRVSTDPNRFVIESPTKASGTWIKLSVGKQSVSLLKSTIRGDIEYSLVAPLCTAKLSVFGRRTLRKSSGLFTDFSLVQLVKNSKKKKSSGVIFLWSPYMSVSLRGLKEIKPVADSLGLRIIPILDPRADRKTAQDALKKFRIQDVPLRKLASQDLYRRGMTLHYPTMLFFTNGKLYPAPRYGYHEKDRLIWALKNWMAEK